MNSAGTKYEDIVKTYYIVGKVDGKIVYAYQVPLLEEGLLLTPYHREAFELKYGFHTYDQDKVKVGAFFVNTNCREIYPSGRVLRISYNDILSEEELREVQNRKPNGD